MKADKQFITRLLEILKLEGKGFEFIPFLSDKNEYYYEKQFGKSIGVIFLSIVKINYLQGMGCYLHLPEVERIIQPLLVKHGFEKTTNDLNRSLIRPIVYREDDLRVLNTLQKMELDDEIRLEQGVILINRLMEDVFVPFWKKYSDIERINDEIINVIPQIKLAEYIPSQTPLKKLIIMKLCKNPDYDIYMHELKVSREEAYSKDPVANKNRYELFNELTSLLHSV